MNSYIHVTETINVMHHRVPIKKIPACQYGIQFIRNSKGEVNRNK